MIYFPVRPLAGVYRRTIDVPGMPRDFPSDYPQVVA